MSNTCQHCGAKLPQVVDAFCPDCRGRLDEPAARSARPATESPGDGAELPTAPSGTRNTLNGAGIGAAIGLLIAFFVLQGEDVTGRTIGAVVARAVLGCSALGALVGAASDWRK